MGAEATRIQASYGVVIMLSEDGCNNVAMWW